MDSELAEENVGMMPDEFDADTWKKDLSKIVEDFSKQSGVSPDEHQDSLSLVRTWKKDGEVFELVIHNERITRKGEEYSEDRVTVWTLSGMPFTDLKIGKPIPPDANVWGICLPFAPDDVQRKEILTMVEANLANF